MDDAESKGFGTRGTMGECLPICKYTYFGIKVKEKVVMVFAIARNWSAGRRWRERLALGRVKRGAKREKGGCRTRLWRDAGLEGGRRPRHGDDSRCGTSVRRALPTGRAAWSFK